MLFFTVSNLPGTEGIFSSFSTILSIPIPNDSAEATHPRILCRLYSPTRFTSRIYSSFPCIIFIFIPSLVYFTISPYKSAVLSFTLIEKYLFPFLFPAILSCISLVLLTDFSETILLPYPSSIFITPVPSFLSMEKIFLFALK